MKREGGHQKQTKRECQVTLSPLSLSTSTSTARRALIRTVVVVALMGQEAEVVGQEEGKGLVLDDWDQRGRIVDKAMKEGRRRKAQNVAQQEILCPKEHEIVARRRRGRH